MAEFRDTLIQTVRDKFPKGGWGYGGLIRELIIEPLCAIGDIVDSYLDKKMKLLDVASLLESPAENEEQIDEWLESLNLTVPESIAATGSVIFVTSSPDPVTIMEGSTFTWNDTYTVYASDTVEFNSENPLRKLGENAYIGEIPVTTGNSVTNISLAANSPMNWDDAPDSVYDIFVGDAISGGRQEYSIQQKAQILSNYFSETGLCGAASIRATLSRMFPDSFVDVDINKSYKSTYNTVSLFLKQKREATSRNIKCAVLTNGNSKEIVLKTDAVLSIEGVYSLSGDLIKYEISGMTSKTNFGDYNSSTKIILKNCNSDVVVVKVKEFADINNFMQTINGELSGTPFSFSCELPAIANVSMQIPTSTDIPNAAIVEIQEYISESKLNAVIYDNEISAILSKYNIKLIGGILYTGEIKTADNAYGFAMTGHLSLAGYQGLSLKPIALCTSANLIKGVR